jgi:hypothetical protein
VEGVAWAGEEGEGVAWAGEEGEGVAWATEVWVDRSISDMATGSDKGWKSLEGSICSTIQFFQYYM